MLAAVLAALSAGLTCGSALAADQTLELEVMLNGAPTGKIGEFILRGGSLYARRRELEGLGLKVPTGLGETSDGLIALSALADVTARLDAATQTLHVGASETRLAGVRLNAGESPDATAPATSSVGATLNYDVSGFTAAGETSIGGLFDLRAFSPWGVASTTALAHGGAAPVGQAGSELIRLDSAYTYSDFDSLRRYRLGDFINGGLAWTRPVRLGGAQISRDFSMRPDLVTFPVPLVTGSAAVPSTVDVLVNGAQLYSQKVGPGPFQVSQIPVVTGAGVVETTVTNALGQQVSTSLPFYASSDMLAPGLQTWSLEVGFLRRNWSVVSNDYGAFAASASYRRGLSSAVTLEAHAEGTSGQVMAGGGLVVDAFDLAVLNLAVAGSSASGRHGGEIAVGVQRLTSLFSFGVSAIFANDDFRDIAAMDGSPAPRRQISANAGLSLRRWGSLGIAYTELERGPGFGGLGSGSPLPPPPALHSRVLSANYSLQVHNVAVYANAFHDFLPGGAAGGLIGVSIPLGPRASASASAGAGEEAPFQAQAQQSASSVGDWGYQLYASAEGPGHVFGLVQYKSPWALLTAGGDHFAHVTSARVDLLGALTFTDGRLFATNEIQDSFAVVETGGVAGVPVLSENRLAGMTGRDGRLLVPDLRAYEVNRLSIDPANLPANATVSTIAKTVRPRDRSGVVVRFPVRFTRGALLVLVDVRGKPLPVGSRASLIGGAGAAAPVGYDGETYLEDLKAQNRLSVQLPGGHACAVAFAYEPRVGQIPKIGPLTCKEARP